MRCNTIPRAVIIDFDCLVLFMMKNILTDDQVLDIMWRIGNVVRDPSSRPYVVFQLGRRRGEGKGLLINIFSMLLRGVLANLPGESLSHGSKTVSDEIRQMFSIRLAFFDDVKGDDVTSRTSR